jgi:ribosomal protein S18 acetylase RimI-like enzyme
MNANRRRCLFFSAIVALLDVFIVLQTEMSFGHALVVTSPRWEGDARTRTGTIEEAPSEKTRPARPELQLRIRSTVPKDIPMVSDILTHALLEEEEGSHTAATQPSFNFKKRMEFLRTKAGVVTLLHSRMEAIATGTKLWQLVSESSLEGLNDKHKLRYLWSNDIFRNKLERACKLSDEPHGWKDYNFACAPDNSDKLFHKMLTAENVATGEVVGFCEVAMLSQPTHWRRENSENNVLTVNGNHDTNEGVPTIVNLVTSTGYRRRGVASSILRTALKYVQLQRCSEELALYVEQNNNNAVRMYMNLGFETKYGGSNQLYMKAGVTKQ